jgi:hypothetical protein
VWSENLLCSPRGRRRLFSTVRNMNTEVIDLDQLFLNKRNNCGRAGAESNSPENIANSGASHSTYLNFQILSNISEAAS